MHKDVFDAVCVRVRLHVYVCVVMKIDQLHPTLIQFKCVCVCVCIVSMRVCVCGCVYVVCVRVYVGGCLFECVPLRAFHVQQLKYRTPY